MVFFMCHCLAWFISDYIQLTGVQVAPFHSHSNAFILKCQFFKDLCCPLNIIYVLGCDCLLMKVVALQGGSLCFSKLDFAVAWFIRESMAVQIFLSALWDPTISWRTGRYRLRCGGTAEEILDV